VVSLHPEFKVTASGLTRVVVSIAMAVASITAAPAPAVAAKRTGDAAVCKAQGSAARLDVRCPSATVAELLAALRQATGLRSEYPPDLARARVSITLRRASLVEVLEHALSAFNFAVWTDQQGTPSVTWVKIVDARRTVAHLEQPGAAMLSADVVSTAAGTPTASEVTPSSAAAPPPSEMAPTSAASRSSRVAPTATAAPPTSNLTPPRDKAQMALVLETFARSVTPATPLEVPPVDVGARMPPVSTSPVTMPGLEMPR
jgi:hypothetical protein